MGPELGVSYTYLSKLENQDVVPSEEFVRKVAEYFEYDEDQLLLEAGRVPIRILRILQDHPEEARLLLERFGRVNRQKRQ